MCVSPATIPPSEGFRPHNTNVRQTQGGSRFYTSDKADALLNATAVFSETNTDPKAQMIMTLEGLPALEIIPVVIFFYDGPSPGDAFAAFDGILPAADGVLVQSFSSFVAGQATELLSYVRGTAHTVSVSAMTPAILDAVNSEVEVRRFDTYLVPLINLTLFVFFFILTHQSFTEPREEAAPQQRLARHLRRRPVPAVRRIRHRQRVSPLGLATPGMIITHPSTH